MAVTGDLFKGFTFGSISSKDYDVYITQESAYDAPQRDVEFIDIAGRNGAYVLDKGRFLNIQVSYRCGLVGVPAGQTTGEWEFREKIRQFRNALASQVGYKRLTDDYHPTRFREALFADGINVEMADRRAGEFTVTFNCKPQRFLTDGERRRVFYQGSTQNTRIVNPTQFDSYPLIDFTASADGSFTIGDYTISVVDALIGRIPLSISKTSETMPNGRYVDTLMINNTSSYQTGDAITLDGFDITADFTTRLEIRSAYFTDVSGLITSISRAGGYRIVATLRSDTLSLVAGTSSTVTLTATLNASYRGGGADSLVMPVVVSYDGDSTITITATVGYFMSGSEVIVKNKSSYSGIVDSTVNTLTETIYLDCATGNAYSIIDGNIVSMNNHVSFGAELPVLPSGETLISRSGTEITSLFITPRWWEV